MIEQVTIEWSRDTKFRLTGKSKCDSLNPKQMMLYATAECAGITVMTILTKERIRPKHLEITMSGVLDTDTVMAKSIFTSFHIAYNIECRSIDDQVKISRAVNLTNDKYCGTLQMMRRIAPVSHETAIVSSEEVNV